MRQLFGLALIVVLTAAGCARGAKGQHGAGQRPGYQQLVVNPEASLVGRVVRSNASARFAVLNFPIGHLPALDQRLNVYRAGQKVGEIKVTGPQLDDNIVGDILAGEAQPGDEVREH
jgi:hypothetical protein